jgi:hypothetical protein
MHSDLAQVRSEAGLKEGAFRRWKGAAGAAHCVDVSFQIRIDFSGLIGTLHALEELILFFHRLPAHLFLTRAAHALDANAFRTSRDSKLFCRFRLRHAHNLFGDPVRFLLMSVARRTDTQLGLEEMPGNHPLDKPIPIVPLKL